MSDARFEDAYEKPLQLLVVDEEDLKIISALLQDAVFTKADVKWDKQKNECAFLFNRFRWEEGKKNTPAERVRTLAIIRDVENVQMRGLGKDKSASYALLSVRTHKIDGAGEADEGGYRIILTLSGQGEFGIDAHCINIVMRDVTRPYRAVSGKKPAHDKADGAGADDERVDARAPALKKK